MTEKQAVEKAMLTQAYNGRKPGSPMEWGEAGIRARLKARRARVRRPDSFPILASVRSSRPDHCATPRDGGARHMVKLSWRDNQSVP